jgi:hypothetical protein
MLERAAAALKANEAAALNELTTNMIGGSTTVTSTSSAIPCPMGR